MTPFLQLLVAVGVAVCGAVIALRIDKKEHCDSRQHQIPFPEQNDDLQHRGVAMSRLH